MTLHDILAQSRHHDDLVLATSGRAHVGFFSTSLTIFFVGRLRPRTSAASTQCSIEVESSRNECNVGERLRGVA